MPFEQLEHLVVIPVVLDGVERRFILDSGIGLTIVRDTIGGCAPRGRSFTGKRMSGQAVTVPLATARTVEFAGVEQKNAAVGLLDMSLFPAELERIDGFLSLAFFAAQPFTVDYHERLVRDGTGAEGTAVPLRLARDDPSLTAFMPLTIPGRTPIEVEVDMGSDSLILGEHLAEATDTRLDDKDVRVVSGTDETGNPFTRYFTKLQGTVHPADAPQLAQRDPDVMFQRIIYDGLIGHAFLSRFRVTWDLPGSRLLFS